MPELECSRSAGGTRASVVLAFALVATGAARPAAVSGDDTASDADIGFSDVTTTESPAGLEPNASDQASPWRLEASFRLYGALRLEQSNPTRLGAARQLTDLKVDFSTSLAGASLRAHAGVRTELDYAYLSQQSRIDAVTYDLYAWRFIPGETFISVQWPALAISTGAQIVSFGQGEMLSVLDVVNPRDLREPLLTDPGDMRLPVLMTRARLSIDRVFVEALVVHAADFGLTPPPLGEFSPLRWLLFSDPTLGPALENTALRIAHVPRFDPSDLGATQFHGRVQWSAPDVDLSVSASSLLDPMGVPRLPDPSAFNSQIVEMAVLHPRYTLFGHSGALTFGPWLLRWELAFELQRPYTVRRTDARILTWSAVRSSTLRGMLGFTFAPSASTSAAFEVTQARLFQNPDRRSDSGEALVFPVELPNFALRFSQSILRERLTVSALAILIGLVEVNAWAARLEAKYALADALAISIGYVTYQPGRAFGPFSGFSKNDRLFVNLRWDTAL